MPEVSQVEARFTADISDLSAKMTTLTGALVDVQSKVENVGSNMTSSFISGAAVVGLAVGAFSTLKGFLTECVGEAASVEKTVSQMNATIRATHGAAGMSMSALRTLADELVKTSIFSDDAILSAENMALTYTNIHSNVFPRFMKTAVDVASKTGDLSGASNMLGRALENPLMGMRMLRSMHVTLSGEQQKAIKDFMKVNDVASAQGIILDAVSSRYAGQAAAAVDTYSGRLAQLKNSFDDVKQTIGKAMLPILENWMKELNKEIGKVGESINAHVDLSKTFFQVGKYAEGAFLVLKTGIDTIWALGKTVFDVIKTMMTAFKDLVIGLGTVGQKFVSFGAIGVTVMADIGKAVISLGKPLADLGKSLYYLITGDFAKAKESFMSIGTDFVKAFDLSATKKAVEDFNSVKVGFDFSDTVDTAKSAASDIGKQWSKVAESGTAAAEKFSDGFNIYGWHKVKEGAEEAGNSIADYVLPPMKDTTDKASKEAEKLKEESVKAAQDLSSSLKEVHKQLGEAVVSFSKESAQALEDFNSRASEVNKKIAKETSDWKAKLADLDQKDADRKKKNSDEVLSSYEKEKSSLADLQKQVAEFWSGKIGGESDAADFSALQDKAKKQLDIVKQFESYDPNISQRAAEDQAKTPLDRLLEKFKEEDAAAAKEREKEKQNHDLAMAQLDAEMKEEQAAYEKQKLALSTSTAEKMNQLYTQTVEGWDRAIAATKVKVAEMNAATAELKSAQASIKLTGEQVTSYAAGAKSVEVAGKRASGGPVLSGKPYIVGENGPEVFVPPSSGSITPNSKLGGQTSVNLSVMQGTTVHVHNEADEARLAKTISRELARTIQTLNLGMATAL